MSGKCSVYSCPKVKRWFEAIEMRNSPEEIQKDGWELIIVVKFRWSENCGAWTWLNSSVYVRLRIYLTTSGLLLSSLTNAFFEDAMWLAELYPNVDMSFSATVHVSWKFERKGLMSCRSCSSLFKVSSDVYGEWNIIISPSGKGQWKNNAGNYKNVTLCQPSFLQIFSILFSVLLIN